MPVSTTHVSVGSLFWDRIDHARGELACGVWDFDVVGVDAADRGGAQRCNLRARVMKHRYTPYDYLHFARFLLARPAAPATVGQRLRGSVRDGSFKLRAAAVVQLIPTEAAICVVHSAISGATPVTSAPAHVRSKVLIRMRFTSLIRNLSPRDSMINVHGGEPFAYKQIDGLYSPPSSNATSTC
jgi:hypothetical protein